MTGISTEAPKAGATACRFCMDPIHPKARVCKSCGSPQGLVWRAVNAISTALSPIVAALSIVTAMGSLNFASREGQRANEATSLVQAKESELEVQASAAERGMSEVLAVLPAETRKTLATKLTPKDDLDTLERRVKTNPRDIESRKNLLFRRVLEHPPG